MTRRQYLLMAACAVGGLLVLDPRPSLPQPLFRYLFVIDITQSMNTPDYHQAGRPNDRLGYVKAALRASLAELPCGSEVGLGVFTSHITQLLFKPLEVCAHGGVMDEVIAHLDWRMAWAANSQIDQGVATALHRIREDDPSLRLVFFTDGQTAPGEPRLPDFSGDRGKIKGMLVGVGSSEPSLVPRYDQENRFLGYFLKADLGTQDAEGGDIHYRSWLDEPHLRTLALASGLDYHRLYTVDGLTALLTDPSGFDYQSLPLDLRPWMAGLALLLLLSAVLLA